MKTQSRQSVLARAARASVEALESRRLLAAGDLDTTFGDAGKKIVNDWELLPTDSAVQADDKILVSGFGLFDVGHVMRLNADGSVDRSFGSNGLASSGFGPYTAIANAVAVGPGGRIAVAGVAGPYDRGDTTPRQSTLVVYDSAGKLDTTFSGDGILNATQFPRGFTDVQFQPDRKILALGEKLVRYDQSGSLDTTFGGGDGIVDVSGKEIIVQPDGKILALGYFALFRFNANGTPDTTFDGDGVLPSIKGNDIALAPDSDILLAGNGVRAELVTRFNSDGSIDRFFGANGSANVPGALRLAVTRNNVFVASNVTSSAAPTSSLQFTALTHGGDRDQTLGGGTGQWTFALSPTRSTITDLQIHQNKLLAVADTQVPVNDPPGFLISVPGLARFEISGPGQSPFGRTPVTLPGTIEVENFDRGGEGIAYHDTDAANLGNQYRDVENVDIQQIPVPDPNGQYYVGFVKAGEWLEYTVTVDQAGTYDLAVTVSHLQAGGQFHLELDGARLGPNLTVPRTGDWIRFTAVTQRVTLPAGQHVLRLAFDANGSLGYVGNFDRIRINPIVSPQSPFKGVPFKPGDRIQAEDFDNGGQGVAYHDIEPQNLGGAYRPGDGVDIQTTTDAGGGHNVGFMRPGEWLEYTLDVAETANYEFLFRVASLRQGGIFNVLIDGQQKVAIRVNDTGDWQRFVSLRVTQIGISAGTRVLRLQMESPGALGYVTNLNWFDFQKSS